MCNDPSGRMSIFDSVEATGFWQLEIDRQGGSLLFNLCSMCMYNSF